VLDLRRAHERFGSSSDPSINGHLHYPYDVDRSLSSHRSSCISLVFSARVLEKAKTRQVARSRGQRCGDIELAGYLTNATGQVP
jgi:hypothetical protein